MNGLGTSQLDYFLTFSELHLLFFSSTWKLVDLHPCHYTFLGFDETSIESFSFENNFLKPNNLNLPQFLGQFHQKDFLIRNFYWRDVNEQVSGPYETYFRIKKEKGQIKSLIAFVKLSEKTEKLEIPPTEKYNLFLARALPGLIHNINGPLGTLVGRIELLTYKYQQIKEFNELLKMGFKLQEIIENLSFKLVNERFFQPVEINLNRLLKEELRFLHTDLFLKHQIEIQEKYSQNIPQFQMYYLALSGVLSECYYFFRQFVYEDQEYILHVNTFFDEGIVGFSLKLLGNFHIPEGLNHRFPFSLSGNGIKIAQERFEGIDTAFLAYCLKLNRGHLQLNGRKEMMSMRLEFPLPKS